MSPKHYAIMPAFSSSSNTAIRTMPSAFDSYKPRHMKVYGSICVNECGEVLLVRGRLSNKWSFPKGHCKRGETNLECAQRELQEETGLIVDNNYVSYHNLRGAAYYVFAIHGSPIIQTKDNWEILEAAWWPLQSLPKLDSNIDVSIFRTLMKSMRCEDDALVFIESSEAKRRVAIIQQNIDLSSSINTIPVNILPINIPFSS